MVDMMLAQPGSTLLVTKT